ncbi:hypothetical protein LTSERUB_6680, partial [Salmonella enterica subsp. enterica serovar Rubislaw str. A4-653]
MHKGVWCNIGMHKGVWQRSVEITPETFYSNIDRILHQAGRDK